MESSKVFVISVKENAEFLTVENIKFAIEGCFPQIEITEIMEGYFIPFEYPIRTPEENEKILKESFQKLKDAWKKATKGI